MPARLAYGCLALGVGRCAWRFRACRGMTCAHATASRAALLCLLSLHTNALTRSDAPPHAIAQRLSRRHPATARLYSIPYARGATTTPPSTLLARAAALLLRQRHGAARGTLPRCRMYRGVAAPRAPRRATTYA